MLADLIAGVLAEHRRTGLRSTTTWACNCGATGRLTEAQQDRFVQLRTLAEQHVAEQIVAAIEASQPDHLIQLNDAGWVIQHSMACRLHGQLFDCPYNIGAVEIPGGISASSGRYRCQLDKAGYLVIGEAVAQDA